MDLAKKVRDFIHSLPRDFEPEELAASLTEVIATEIAEYPFEERGDMVVFWNVVQEFYSMDAVAGVNPNEWARQVERPN